MAAYTTIDDPEAYFQTVLYTGNATDDRNITLDGDTDMQPDLVWIKERSSTSNSQLTDAVRGVGVQLYSDDRAGEGSNANRVQVFNSDGFQIGDDSSVNQDTITHVAWCWKESATAGFDIVSYSGTGSSADVSHSLSAVPDVIFTKQRTDDQYWFVYTSVSAMGSQKSMHLNTTAAVSTQAAAYDATPTSSVINYGDDAGVNASSNTYIAYLWRSVQGYSKFGSYTGNGDADGPMVFTGFRPAWLMIKATGATQGWEIWDNKRTTYNGSGKILAANSTAAERSNATWAALDFLSNGFKPRYNDALNNTDGSTYVYMAFAEAPLVNSEGVPCNAR